MAIAHYAAVEKRGMPLAKITGPGLAAIAAAVALLWGCALGEHVMMRRALRDRAQVMRNVVRGRQQTQPVSLPAPLSHPRLHFNEG